jgi:hypothetical protein
MAASITAYDHLWKLLLTGGIDLDTDTLKLALVTSGYTFSAAHTVWADVSAHEVAAGSGYTTGGVALANVAATNPKIDFDDPTWASLTKTFRGGVCYKDGNFGAITKPLLFYILFDTTPADIINTGSNFGAVLHATYGLIYRPA